MSDRNPTTALGWLEKAIHSRNFAHDRELEGWLLSARETLNAEHEKSVRMINAAMRIGGKDAAMLVEGEEVTILRGRVAELERQLWQARHDYGQAMQQNARHAATIADLRKARTAEDERRDVLAFIADRAAMSISDTEPYHLERLANALRHGDHVGADREAVKP